MNTINQIDGKNWTMIHGDSVECIKGLPDKSVGLCVHSPPFSSIYTYSNSDRDMGNCKDDQEFFVHYKFLIAELARVMKSGRIVAIHCMDLPTSKQAHGVIGLRDFPGLIIQAFIDVGFIYHSKVTIWKDPVTAMQRTKALGLLNKQKNKDSCMSRQGIPDYLVVMRAPGENTEHVEHTNETFPIEKWQRFASPVWASFCGMDEKGFLRCVNPSDAGFQAQEWIDRYLAATNGIDAGNTLQAREARSEKDERHICPLQLEVIERCVELWSNPGDVVFSPCAGIGSEGYQSLKQGRKFIGIELKESYFKVACENLRSAEVFTQDLFDRVTETPEPVEEKTTPKKKAEK
jgi:DNA modification methylase